MGVHIYFTIMEVMVDMRWKHPFTCLVSGPTGSGKTMWVREFLKYKAVMMDIVPEEVIWYYGSWQSVYDELSETVTFREGLPGSLDELGDDGKPRLVILDDLMSETDDRITKLFTKGSHHRNVSVMYIVQNLFGSKKEHRTISLNAQYMVVFKNPRDVMQVGTLGRQMQGRRGVSYVQDAFIKATDRPHGYLLFDLRQDTPENLRLRSNIFPPSRQDVYVQQ